ncbi:DHRS11.2 family protein [Megaselia abdita]
MDRLNDKIAAITGAGSGIGAACAIDFIKKGLIVIGIGRRENKLEAVKQSIPEDLRTKFHIRKCDVQVEKDVQDTFQWISEHFDGIDVLVNCAGVYREGELLGKYNIQDHKDSVYTTVMGTTYCVREAFGLMKSGHIFFITSQFVKENGYIPYWEDFNANMFAGSMHALKAMVETYRQEFREKELSIKTTNISIGVVASDIRIEDIRTFVAEFPFLEAERVSDAILFALQTPPNVEITNISIKPLGERF